MQQAWKAARSILFCYPLIQQLPQPWAAQQPPSIPAKLSQPGVDRSPSWQQQQGQTGHCVWHSHSWGKWKERSSLKPLHSAALPSAPQGFQPAFQDTARRPVREFGFSKTHTQQRAAQNQKDSTSINSTSARKEPWKRAVRQLYSPSGGKRCRKQELLY